MGIPVECSLRTLNEMEGITIESDLEPDSNRWNHRICYTKPDWYSLYGDEGGTKFYRGEFPTFCRIRITE